MASFDKAVKSSFHPGTISNSVDVLCGRRWMVTARSSVRTFYPHTAALTVSVDFHFCSMLQYTCLHRSGALSFGRQRDSFGDQDSILRTIPGVPKLLGPVSELGSHVLSQKRPRVIVRVKIDFCH